MPIPNQAPAKWQAVYDPLNSIVNHVINKMLFTTKQVVLRIASGGKEMTMGVLDSYSLGTIVLTESYGVAKEVHNEGELRHIVPATKKVASRAIKHAKEHPLRTGIFLASASVQLVSSMGYGEIIMHYLTRDQFIKILPQALIPAEYIRDVAKPFNFTGKMTLESAKETAKTVSNACMYLEQPFDGGQLILFYYEAYDKLNNYIKLPSHKNLELARDACYQLSTKTREFWKLSDPLIEALRYHLNFMSIRGLFSSSNRLEAAVSVTLTIGQELLATTAKYLLNNPEMFFPARNPELQPQQQRQVAVIRPEQEQQQRQAPVIRPDQGQQQRQDRVANNPNHSYPKLLAEYGCFKKKLSVNKLANTLWLINGAKGPEAEKNTRAQFRLWAQQQRIDFKESELNERIEKTYVMK